MKKWLSMLLCVALAVTCLPLAALPVSASSDFWYDIENNEATIIHYVGNDQHLVIPSEIEGYPVTKIRETFMKNSSIESLVIPETVTEIGIGAFGNCQNLTSITLSDHPMTIGSGVFYGSSYYKNESNWENDVLYIGTHLIKAKDTLKGVYTVKEGTTDLAMSSFCLCRNLTQIHLPDSVSIIGDSSFESCRNLTDVRLPDQLAVIGPFAFQNCLSLTSMTLPDTVTALYSHTFSNCQSLTKLSLPATLEICDSNAFPTSSSLLTVYFGGSKEQWESMYHPDEYAEQNFTLHYNTTAEHYSTTNVTLEPTCTSGGQMDYTCPCGHSGTVQLPMLEHDYVDDICRYCGANKYITIYKQPQSAVVAKGTYAKVTVNAYSLGEDGDVDLTYRWYYKDKNATEFVYTSSVVGNTYKIQMTNARAGRQLYCVITDIYGNSVQTDTVTIDQKVYISTQPKTAVVAAGKTAKVSVKAVGSDLTYQWYYKDNGATKYKLTTSFKGDTYSVAMTNARAGRKLYCVITDKYGNRVVSNTVTIDQKVGITTQPKTAVVALGKEAKVTVKAAGSGLTYQWYYKEKGGSKFKLTTSFTGNTYAVAMTKARAGRQIYCVVTDKYGNSVKTNTVTIDQKVRIATQPKSVAVSLGQEAKLTVKAEGSGLTYQWYYKDYGATKFKLTTSFTGNTYAVAMTNARAGRQIYCVITDKYGNSVKTNTVTITKS